MKTKTAKAEGVKAAPTHLEAKTSPLVGKFFHRKESDIEWHGRIVAALPEGFFLVEVFGQAMGRSSVQRVVHIGSMLTWAFHDTANQMNAEPRRNEKGDWPGTITDQDSYSPPCKPNYQVGSLTNSRTIGTASEEKPKPILITLREGAKMLAISERTLYTLIHEGQIPVVRLHRAVRLRAVDVEAWAASKIKPFVPGPVPGKPFVPGPVPFKGDRHEQE